MPIPVSADHALNQIGAGEYPPPQLHYKDFAGHQVPLDMYAPQLSGNVFVAENGYRSIYRPDHAYRLFAGVTGGKEDIVQFVSRQGLYLFQKQVDDEGRISFICKESPEWTLKRSGQAVVVSSPKSRKHYFQTFDMQTWVLTRLEDSNYPQLGVDLIYDTSTVDTHPTAVRYPDGVISEIRWDGDRVSSIMMPGNYEASFDYDAAGFLTSLKLEKLREEKEQVQDGFKLIKTGDKSYEKVPRYQTVKVTKKDKVWEHLYELDAYGRITSYLSPCGQQFSYSYAHNDEGHQQTWLMSRTHGNSGTTEVMRHKEVAHGWLIERGKATEPDQPMSEMTLTERIFKIKEGTNMVVASHETQLSEDMGELPETEVLEKQVREAKKMRKAAQQLAERKKMATGTQASEADSDTPVDETVASNVTFSHPNEQGLPTIAKRGDEIFLYEYDQLGRIIAITYPNKVKTSWQYDLSSLLLRKDEILPLQPHATITRTTNYSYDQQRRFKQVTYPDGTELTAKYSCEGLRLLKQNDYAIVKAGYTDFGTIEKVYRRQAKQPKNGQSQNGQSKDGQSEPETLAGKPDSPANR